MNLHTYLRLITWLSVGGKQANKEAREHSAESLWGRKAFLLPQDYSVYKAFSPLFLFCCQYCEKM